MKALSDTYIAVGAGGLAVIAVIWVLLYLIKKLYPLILSLKEDTSAYKEVIKNNTQAVKEVSKSNENVATALKLLDNSTNQLSALMLKHDQRSEGIENDIIRMDEKINSIRKE